MVVIKVEYFSIYVIIIVLSLLQPQQQSVSHRPITSNWIMSRSRGYLRRRRLIDHRKSPLNWRENRANNFDFPIGVSTMVSGISSSYANNWVWNSNCFTVPWIVIMTQRHNVNYLLIILMADAIFILQLFKAKQNESPVMSTYRTAN